MISKVTDSVYYIGVNDHDLDLFEEVSASFKCPICGMAKSVFKKGE